MLRLAPDRGATLIGGFFIKTKPERSGYGDRLRRQLCLTPIWLLSRLQSAPLGSWIADGRGVRRSRRAGAPSGRPMVSAAGSSEIASAETGASRCAAKRPPQRSMSFAELSDSAEAPDKVGGRAPDLVGAVLLKELEATDGDLGLIGPCSHQLEDATTH